MFDQQGRPSVIESERDGKIGIDLKFGSLTFRQEGDTTYAEALVDVIVGTADMAPEHDTRVQMSVKFRADPETDSVLDVTERCRAQIVSTLRAAAEAVDAVTSRTLLYEGWTPPGGR